MNSRILIEAQKAFEKSVFIPYPANFSVGSWWKRIQQQNIDKIRTFNSAHEAVIWSQTGRNSGFDHRIFNKDLAVSIVNHKITKTAELFPNVSLKEQPNIKESDYSQPESLVSIDGIPYSSIFLTHLNYYLRIAAVAGKTIKRIIEIGGGYGALARIFKLFEKGTSYVIVDLPESLFYAYIFLSLNFHEASIAFISDSTKINITAHDFILVPVQLCHVLENENFDVAINTGSLQEMPAITVDFWMKYIQETIHVRSFYSFNYFLNNKRRLSEASRTEANLICPVMDPFWKTIYFRINPEILTVDADRRNWLEVCLERIPPEERNSTPAEYAEELFLRSKLFPKGSNHWFQNIWMAIWCKPDKVYVREMLDGIDLFQSGVYAAVPKNYYAKDYYKPEDIGDFLRFNTVSIKYHISRIVHLILGKKKKVVYRPQDFGEVDYYRQFL